MTPNRTAPPVARKLTERPTAPPLPVLVGDGVPEDRLLVTEVLMRVVGGDEMGELLEETARDAPEETSESKLERPSERPEILWEREETPGRWTKST